MTAVGSDGNNQIFPIAWTVVQAENEVNWKWFLSILAEDLNLGEGVGITVISDQQKVHYSNKFNDFYEAYNF